MVTPTLRREDTQTPDFSTDLF